MNVVLHDLELCNPGIVIFLLRGLGEGVRHDCNEHIEEHYLDQESGGKEKYIAQDSRASICRECINFEFTQAQLVLVLKCVEEPEGCDCWDEVGRTTRHSIQINDVEGGTECHVPDSHDDQKTSNALDRLLVQGNEECC